jgi:hypothetical protein
MFNFSTGEREMYDFSHFGKLKTVKLFNKCLEHNSLKEYSVVILS